jgi:hypothetical protein
MFKMAPFSTMIYAGAESTWQEYALPIIEPVDRRLSGESARSCNIGGWNVLEYSFSD